jgi:hypothetical protein
MSTVRSEQLQRYWDNQINRGHHRRLELYNQGQTDQEIADVLRMTKTGITSWRKRNGLPANGDGGKTFGGKVHGAVVTMTTKEKHKQRLDLYCQGQTDREIAKAAGVTASAITCWRIRHGLAVNSGAGVSMEKALTPDQCEIVRQFFGCLLTMQDQYPDQKIDVGVFMREYRAGGHARRSICAVC